MCVTEFDSIVINLIVDYDIIVLYLYAMYIFYDILRYSVVGSVYEFDFTTFNLHIATCMWSMCFLVGGMCSLLCLGSANDTWWVWAKRLSMCVTVNNWKK